MEEVTNFCENYLEGIETKIIRPIRYEEGPIGAGSYVSLSQEEIHQAHHFILLNTTEIQSYLE